MRKSFALCEAFGLTPFPSPWIPPFQDAARSAREGLSAGTGRPGRRHSRPWRRGPPLPALRCAQRGASVATGGCARVRGGGGGRPRAFGMLPRRGREAARRDHQPQSVYELMTRDIRREMKKPLARKRDMYSSQEPRPFHHAPGVWQAFPCSGLLRFAAECAARGGFARVGDRRGIKTACCGPCAGFDGLTWFRT
jgi:hypothetical protein